MSVLNKIPVRFSRIPADIKHYQKAGSISCQAPFAQGREKRAEGVLKEKKEQAKSFI